MDSKILSWTGILLSALSLTLTAYTQLSSKKALKPLIGYKKVTLGMPREQVQKILQQDLDLEIDTETDYGYFDEEQKYLLKAKRPPILDSVFYQFYNARKGNPTQTQTQTQTQGKEKGTQKKSTIGNNPPPQQNKNVWILYAILLNFNQKYNNYQSLHQRFLTKYGKAKQRTPQQTTWVWENALNHQKKNLQVALILTLDARVKIVDQTHIEQKKALKKAFSGEKTSLQRYYEQLNDRLFEGFE